MPTPYTRALPFGCPYRVCLGPVPSQDSVICQVISDVSEYVLCCCADSKYRVSQSTPKCRTDRAVADELETIVGREYWPYPIYEDLLFYV